MTDTRFEITGTAQTRNAIALGPKVCLRTVRTLCVVLPVAMLMASNSARAQESNPAIDTSRLYPRTIPPTAESVSTGGLATPEGETSEAGDESFGAQQILKTQEKVPEFTITAGVTGYFTNNVALTRSDTQSEAFFVGDTSFSWTPRLNSQLQFQVGAGASVFRYETSALDFESLGAGTGLIWTPPNFWGLALIGRYDFVELLDRHSNQILQDHEFSISVQKLFVLGRAHAFSLAVVGSAGISDPFVEQRDQVGLVVGYHLQLTRYLGSDVGYRISGYFYNAGGRDDLNQVLSLGVHYNVKPWLAVNAFLSAAKNHSNEPVFKYEVLNSGGGLGVYIRF